MKRNCKALKKEQKEEKNQKRVDDQNTTAILSYENLVVLSHKEDECNVVDPHVEWVIDSVASYHATPNKKFFTSYKV